MGDQGYKPIVDPGASSGVSGRSYVVEIRTHQAGKPVGFVIERHGPFGRLEDAQEFARCWHEEGRHGVVVPIHHPPFHALDTLARTQRQARVIENLQRDVDGEADRGDRLLTRLRKSEEDWQAEVAAHEETKRELAGVRKIASRAILAGGVLGEGGDKLKEENERLQYAVRELSQRLDRAKADASAQWTRLQNVLRATVAGLDENAEKENA